MYGRSKVSSVLVKILSSLERMIMMADQEEGRNWKWVVMHLRGGEDLVAEIDVPSIEILPATFSFRCLTHVAAKPSKDGMTLMCQPFVLQIFQLVDEETEGWMSSADITFSIPAHDKLIDEIQRVWGIKKITPADQITLAMETRRATNMKRRLRIDKA